MVNQTIISRARAGVWLVAFFVLLTAPSTAQLRSVHVVHVPPSMTAGQTAVVYLRVDARGLMVGPQDFHKIEAVRYRSEDGWTAARRSTENQFWMLGNATGVHHVAIFLAPITPARGATLFIRPVSQEGEDGRLVPGAPVRIALPESRPPTRSTYRHGIFPSGPDEASSERAELLIPEYHALEFWMRTGVPDQVVATSWSGKEQDPYPFEITVDDEGHIVAYRGSGQQHVSLRSPHPVADGTWHHVSVVSGKWWSLMIDGRAADSLLVRRLPTGESAFRSPVSFGTDYVGSLDEIRLWARSWTPGRVRARMRQHTSTLVETPLLAESFEETGRRSDLMLYRPPRDIQVSFSEFGLTLSWQPGESDARAFIIERSGPDGEFVPVARMDGVSVAEAGTLAWQDDLPQAGMRYYRIRQLHVSGAEVVSAAVKIGAGVEQPDAALPARITGNYPNPFRERTTITFAVDRPADVRISVWDVSGQLVRVLIDRNTPAGIHETPFVPDDLPSGTYFAHLEVDGRTQTHRIVVAR